MYKTVLKCGPFGLGEQWLRYFVSNPFREGQFRDLVEKRGSPRDGTQNCYQSIIFNVRGDN